MSDFPFDKDTDDDFDQTLPQSGVRPTDMDETLPQSGAGTTESELPLDVTQPGGGFVGKYPVTIKLGQGGMGVVWLGYHPDLDIKVAIKTLPTHLISRDPSFVERFIKEARTAARINHANVVRIYDAGNDDDTHYIVMEYVSGGSVHELIKERGSLPVTEALDMIIQVAEGLKAAAEFKIIHRDIKPENIMLDSKGIPKLADLGLAKQLDADEMSMTGTGMAVGTPSYMAPEQVQDAKSCDARADVYSLGATFYHMITGAVPFSASSAFDMMLKHVQEPLPPPKEKKPEIPDNVNAVICKMLEKSQDMRYQTAEELLGDLNKIKYGNAPVKELLAGRTKPVVATVANAQGTNSSSIKKKKSPLPIIAAVCLVAMAIGTFALKDTFMGKPVDEPKQVTDTNATGNATETGDTKTDDGDVNVATDDVVNTTDATTTQTTVTDTKIDDGGTTTDVVDTKDPDPIPPVKVPPVKVPPVKVPPVKVPPVKVPPKKVTPRLGKPIPLDLLGNVLKSRKIAALKMTLVPLRAGSFTMGSDIGMSTIRPAHNVVLTRSFWMATTEVTAAQFGTFVKAAKFKTTAENLGFSLQIERTLKVNKRSRYSWKSASRGNQPVSCVSRNDAIAFCDWLNASQTQSLPVGYEFRLPTEAEWEYASRCGLKSAYGFDPLAEKLMSYAWYIENSRGKSQPVGMLKPNRWQLLDMHGNVSEWCLDSMSDYAKGSFSDPIKADGTEFVVRGGGYVSFSEECEGTFRKGKPSDYTASNVGFRVVLAPVVVH